MSDERRLCRLDELAEGAARGFPPAPGGFTGLVAVRRDGEVRVYVNACPHLGLPLEALPDRFLDGRGEHLVCAAHGARFRVEDGFCVAGPCAGDELEAVPVRIAGGDVLVPADAGL
ncbi:Rieske (2Fe-2S) protein [Roseomonas sp. OT10]|uniref:Rieske (2Fe-2S) protein n=1 Tax=Roseomonas cutis TaxID=2897332 RepID=UPI001E2F97C2|nr:Rieske (2Fe-2S) protein [Roseomonas sp. OT10]UFN48077.1 Rieske (2Fe-2S) protein [Roseomonas sp. OT10]